MQKYRMTQEQLDQLQRDSDELMGWDDSTESDNFIRYLADKYNLKAREHPYDKAQREKREAQLNKDTK